MVLCEMLCGDSGCSVWSLWWQVADMREFECTDGSLRDDGMTTSAAARGLSAFMTYYSIDSDVYSGLKVSQNAPNAIPGPAS